VNRVIQCLPVDVFTEYIIAQCIVFVSALPAAAEPSSTASYQLAASTQNASNGHPSNSVKESSKPKHQSIDVVLGKMLYKTNDCAACHSIRGVGCRQGVPLDGVASRRSKRFLSEQLKDPEEHVAKNQKAFGHDPNLMPQPNLDDREIKFIVKYLMTLR